jgi:hypothetical protein
VAEVEEEVGREEGAEDVAVDAGQVDSMSLLPQYFGSTPVRNAVGPGRMTLD